MIAWLLKHGATVGLVTFCIVLFGVTAYQSMPRESNPDVDIPFVVVTTTYVGASPEDVERLVTTPIENELSGLEDLKSLNSTSSESVSVVYLEFEPEVEIEDALQKIRDRVSDAESDLPVDADDPDVSEVSMNDFPIMIVTLFGPVDEMVIKALGEDLEDEIEKIPGVLEATVTGGREREIKVEVDARRLAHYQLALQDVINAIGNENVNVPGGDVRSGSAKYLVRVPGEFEQASEIESVAVARVGDRPVFVRDVATVTDGLADRTSYSRSKGASAVSVSVTKRSGGNILDIAQAVRAAAEKESESWPDAITWEVRGDQSTYVVDIVKELENGIITAVLLVVGVILFFMGVRNSLFVAFAIPVSMLLGLLIMSAMGVTLNMVVLFSLILVLGMLVDNAIVVVENIYRHAEMGKELKQASVDGTREVAGAVAASTATTVAAFFPLLFWTGIMGEFMGYLPLTVVTVLLSSLFVALVVLPVLTSKLMGRARTSTPGLDPSNPILHAYRVLLEWSIRRRYIALTGLVGALVGTFMAYGALNHGTEFFPDVEPDRATITVRAADGTDLEATDEIVRKIEAIVASEENIDVYVAESGVASRGGMVPSSQSATNEARITLDFLPHHTKAHPGDKPRVEDTRETIERIRTAVRDIPGAEIIIEKERMGPPVGPPVLVEVRGDDYHALGKYASKLRRDLEAIPGVTDVKDNYRVGRPEMRLTIDRGAAKRIGASTREIASTVRTAISGTEAGVIREAENEYDIVVQLEPRFREDLQSIMSLRVPGYAENTPGTFAVPLSSVADYQLRGGSGSIAHVDRDRVITVDANIAEGFNENEVRGAVSDFIDAAKAPQGISLSLGGADDEQRKTQEFLSKAFLVAVFLIALVLVSQFNRFDLPFVILASVTLSFIGVLWGLVITGTSFGIVMTGLGVISLAGVVVNNAIVLLDYVEQLRERGMELHDALVEAGLTRFRPVMLTAITTILGLIPMGAGIGIDFASLQFVSGSQTATWWGPMAVAVIFGLAFATLLTLVFVPTAYTVFEDLRNLRERIFQRLSPKTAPAAQQGGGE